MALIRQYGAAGATGYALEFKGLCIAALSAEARMLILNMGARGLRGAFDRPPRPPTELLLHIVTAEIVSEMSDQTR